MDARRWRLPGEVDAGWPQLHGKPEKSDFRFDSIEPDPGPEAKVSRREPGSGSGALPKRQFKMASAIFSAAISVGKFVLAHGTSGKIEASTTRKPSTPRTRP